MKEFLNSVDIITPSSSTFSVRSVVTDYYLTSPIPGLDVCVSEFRGSEIKQVPIIRIFGSTQHGQKVCLHVHGVFPYLYIPCGESEPEPKFLYQIASSIDKAINISLKQTNANTQHVYKITLVKGKPFYGYHYKDHQFLKIFFYNPSSVKRAADLLQRGVIMGLSYQPHEAHINYIMQFSIDFNLYGMSFVKLEQVKFRRKSGIDISSQDEKVYLPDSVPILSSSELEADCLAQHILNRLDVLNGNLSTNPGLEALWIDEQERHKNLNISSDIHPTQSQIRDNVPVTETHKHYNQKLIAKLLLNPDFNDDTQLNLSVLNDNDPENLVINIIPSKLIYPAETPNESDYLDATKVILHHPNTIIKHKENFSENSNSYVIEDIIQLSQIKLDDDDIQMMANLKDLETNQEEDSILGTQSKDESEDALELEADNHSNISDQIFDHSDDESTKSFEWENSYWDGVENISQLDGAWDESSSKKSRKEPAPKRTLRVGLSRNCKRKLNLNITTNSNEKKVKTEVIDVQKKFQIFSPKNSPVKLSPNRKSPKSSPNKTPRNFKPLTVKVENFHSTSKSLSTDSFISEMNEVEEINSSPENSLHSDYVKINIKQFNNTSNDSKNKIDIKEKSRAITSSQYDRSNNFIPIPGTSKIVSRGNHSPSEEDTGIISFYNSSKYQDSSIFCDDFDDTDLSPLDFKPNSTNPKLIYQDSHETLKLDNTRSNDSKVLIPIETPPSYDDVKSTMKTFNIDHHKSMNPYYSNHKDAKGQKIEVGQMILKIKSKNIENLKEFPTTVSNNVGLNFWREKLFLKDNISQVDTRDLDILLSSNRHVVLCPVNSPPTSESVQKWLASYKMKKRKDTNELDEHEEFKIDKLQLLMPGSPGEEFDDSQMERMSLSSSSLTPATPEVFNKTCFVSLETPTDVKSTSKLQQKDSGNPLYDSMIKRITENNIIKCSQESNDSDIICGQVVKPKPEIDSPLIKQNKISNSDETYNSPSNNTREEIYNVTNGFKFSGDNYQDAAVNHEYDYLTVITLEVLVSTRGDCNPDPEFDSICAVFYSILNNCPENHKLPQTETGIIAIDEDFNKANKKWLSFYPEISLKHFKFTTVENERNIFDEVVALINKWDPDILCGYEIEMSSWGYLFQRGFLLEIDMASDISRIKVDNRKYKTDTQFNNEIKVIGRITLDVWRVLRYEVALTSYSFENVVYHVLHERIPSYTYKILCYWWKQPTKLLRSLSMEYYLTRVTGVIRLLLQLDLIGRTSELARLFGIQWYEVLSRGSQFRVESMMIRLTRPLNYVLVSPSVQQRAAMKSPEFLPLILEPESRFYGEPVIVLDFQSLYPSMMIAYNYCYSTCLGKVDNLGKNTPFIFGASHLRVSNNFLKKLIERELINWSPCGVGFVKPSFRKGILPTMLQNILNTRFMVKKSMKKHKKNKTLQKILHSRQLGLKLIANVTYGYTAANYSGRMPCVEVGDSVVAKGRETLERAIKMIENTDRWNARVVYGDTDSVFVLVAGRSRSEAFDIGAEIAEAVTNDNPTPVKLKLEKVYQPCILQTKKRYVGYMYESKDQEKPVYEAKGIETVRRDGCPAVSKILEKTLRILFDTYDMSKVKSFICRKFQNMLEGKCNIQDFIFAREFRGMHAYKPTASVPALEIARRLKISDKRKEPREGQRVPYIIINGAPHQSILQTARSPHDLLADPSLRVNLNYYITRVIIPPLNRCLTLIGADVNQWFNEMPRKQIQLYPIIKSNQADNKKNTISQYFAKVNCVGCDSQSDGGICKSCINKPQETYVKIQSKVNDWQRNYNSIKKICQSCCGRAIHLHCSSIDCPVLFHLNVANQELEQAPFFSQMEKKLLSF